jgi:hypothetical protein
VPKLITDIAMFIVHSDPEVKSMEKLKEEEETNQGNLLDIFIKRS